MSTGKSIFSDLIGILWSPKRFFEERFLLLDNKRAFLLGFIGVFLGVAVGSALMAWFSEVVIRDFSANKEPYVAALKSLSLTEAKFTELLRIQQAYCLLLLVTSPLLAYVIPHLFGGALFIVLWSLVKPSNINVTLTGVIPCTSSSLSFMAFYAIPIVGPIFAAILVFINLSRALYVQYQITGFIKGVCILLAMYVCFFLVSATLQLLALPFAEFIR